VRTGFARAIGWATIAVHVTLGVALAAMTLPSFENIARQLRSGYAPPDYWLYPLVVLTALALAASIGVGLVQWTRGSRRLLVGVDLAVLGASWTFLLVFVFSNNLPIVTAALSPIAPLLAWRAPADGSRRDVADPRL
jgi:hypothetical protein